MYMFKTTWLKDIICQKMCPEELLKECGWVLCDDYNMVENRWDKSSNCEKAISNKEIMAWDVFKQSLRMRKCLHTLIGFIPKF